MKYVDAGYGKVPLLSLIAILSISLTVNLPGLAISPIMGKLDHVFNHVTELEIQLLTVLPNLVTIPFILCSGKICTQKNQIFILGIGLTLYTLVGVLYFFANSMIELILLSCMLGVGCGLVIPLAASLVSQYFTGKARTRQLGMKSSLSNFTVIFATLFVGWMAAINWHLAFIVYLIPIIPLALLPFMTNGYIRKNSVIVSRPPYESAPIPAAGTKGSTPNGAEVRKPASPDFHFSGKKVLALLFGIMALYFAMTYGIEVISYYLPFTMDHYKLSTGDVGIATAMFFAAATVSGFMLTKIIQRLRHHTVQIAIALCIAGLLLIGLFHFFWSFVVGVFIMGFGYGIVQPVLYDKISYIAPTAAKSTAYFSYLLTCNYIGISIVPFIVGGAKRLFDAGGDPNFSFIFNAGVLMVVLCIAIWKRRNFVFEADDTFANSVPSKKASAK